MCVYIRFNRYGKSHFLRECIAVGEAAAGDPSMEWLPTYIRLGFSPFEVT